MSEFPDNSGPTGFEHYDSWKCSAPEDERGIHDSPPEPRSADEARAQELVAHASMAVNVLAYRVRGAEIHIGGSLSLAVLQEIAKLVRAKVRSHAYEPGPALRAAGAYAPGPWAIDSVEWSDRGVRVYGFGSRPGEPLP